MPNEEFGGNENNTSKPSNPGDNTVDPGDDAKTLAVTRKILSSSLDGKHYSSKSQTQQWIVIHNTGGGTAESAYNWFNNPSNTYQTSAHYCVDDKQIIQCLEDNWKGHHAGGSGVQYNDKWRPSNSEDCTNSNSIGIEVADWGGDYKGEQFGKAIENAIDLTISLMKKHNIDVNHVIRHGDTQAKDCPMFIMKEGKWGYFKEQLSNRTGGTLITNDGSNSSNSSSSGGYDGNSNFLDILPNQDHRYNIANMEEVTGACLIFLPPYNVCTLDQQAEHFKTWNNWDRKYHYILDPLYDVDANPDDDIPDLTNAKGIDEMNNPSSDNTNNENPEEGTDDSDNNYADPDELPEDNRPRTIQPRAPLGPDDMDSGTNTPQQPGDGGDGPQGVSLDRILLIGDSLTVGMKSVLEKVYPNGTAMGKGGKWATQWLQDLDSLPPATSVSCVVQWLGINGVHNNKKNISDSQELLTKLKAKYPGIPIYNMRIFPVGKNYTYNGFTGDWWRGLSQEFNAAMSSWCASNGVTQIDATEGFITSDGYLDESKTVDKLHFNTAGYEQILSNMARAISSGTPGGVTPSQPVGPKAEEDNSIVIKGGFLIETPRLLQCYGLEDNDKATYISRSLYDSKPQAHCIMIGCFIPTYDDLIANNTTYIKVEKNIINAVSKILWANGLKTEDLWREFDMNRSPSPANYLDRNHWKDLLSEINKQLIWRNKKFGEVKTKYEKYIAVIPDQTIPNTGSTTPGDNNSGSNPDIGNISDNAQAIWTFFTGSGYSKECTAGIMGNLQQESGLDPNSHQSGGGKGRGLAQWSVNESRYNGLVEYAKGKGKEWTDLQCQLEWIVKELNDDWIKKVIVQKAGSFDAWKTMTDINKACDIFEAAYERAGIPAMEKRYKFAKQFYDKFANSSTSGSQPAIATASIMSTRTIQPRAAQFSWPTPGITSVTSKFGPRTPPCPGASSYHAGIDIGAPMNTDVKATAAGTVTFYGFHKSAGNYMVIDHGNGWGSRYLHLSSNVAKKGDQVSANQTIAKSGDTGVGTGAHLHFEIHNNFPAGGTKGTAVDPLQYVNPGETVGDPNVGDSSTSTSPSAPSGSTSGPLVNSIWGEIANPGPAANLPYNGNSMGGLEHDEWGGKMSYYVDEAKDPEAEKPEIEYVLTDLDYHQFCQQYFEDEAFKEDGTSELTINFNKFWQFIDILSGEQEPYDKGLVNASDAAITPNERLSALTTTFTTDNENVFHFSVIESGPGSKDHCVKAADELNYIITPTDLRVEPIYPDLIIPPQYTTAGYDSNSDNSIPLSLLTEVEGKDFLSKQLSFDYDILNDIKKETNKSFGPVNFMDPYPTDDKIEELEQHYPKVFIDEIESQIYSCNHPGCPIGQPMAKNFAMLSDALMNQSKRTEKRLVRLENILSTIMRNQARLSSRININCVYYGGQSTYAGKYKCIRCMHDDRIHDGAIVTLDQCLNCTRYEPILGQVYQILDETGFNGSIVLDDMQMSYASLDTYKRQNIQSQASPKYNYVNANDDTLTKKPEKDLIEQWKEANKKLYLDSQPEKVVTNIDVELQDVENEIANSDEYGVVPDMSLTPDANTNINATQTVTTDPEVEQALESKYIFRMNWNETFLNSQQPDTKQYPTEGIIMRFKKETGDFSFDEEIKELDPEKDKDTIEDLQRQLKLVNGQWTDTRETAETVQINKYSSEKFYFKGFAEIKKTNGLGSSSSSSSGSTGAGAECRKKICEMAETIVQECKDGKAWYSQTNRTVDYNNPGYHNGKKAYDCTGLVSCCYLHAGLKSMYAKSAGGGSLMDEIVNNGGEMWLMDDAGFEKAKPGDVLVTATSNVTQDDMGKKVSINHAMIYMGDKTIAHAANSKKGIVKEAIEDWRKGKTFFVRPKDLIDADAQAAASGGSSGQVNETEGEVDGKKYVARILGAVCTSYTGSGAGASGMGCEYNKTCASHNMPYGTKIYIPQLADKLGGDGILTVTDTGGCFFDFDLFTQSNIGKVNADVYVLEWGTGKVAASYTWAINYYLGNGRWNGLKSAWNKYKEMGGKLMTFLKFSQEDANIKNHPNYNDK